MADFASSLFLGRRHGGRSAPDWSSFTSGLPAAMQESPRAPALAARVALSQGTAAGVVHRSALHALIDVVDLTAERGSVVLLDRAAYPLAFTAAAGVVARGVPLGTYRHHDVADLSRIAERLARPPVVVTDGWCSGCSRPAPLPDLERAAAKRGGVLIVDDTLAFGLIGARHSADCAFGEGGGGTCRWLEASTGAAVFVASLAKSYGAPLAVTTGPVSIIDRLRGHGSRWHSSPPTAADLAAATRATADTDGNTRRRNRLCRLVCTLRAGLTAVGLRVIGLPFPLVSVAFTLRDDVAWVHRELARRGIRTLPIRPRCLRFSTLTFALTASLTAADIDQALTAMEDLQAA